MFPVLSKLRRSAMKVIYTDSPELRAQARLVVFDQTAGAWKSTRTVSMTQIESKADGAQRRAMELCVYENELFDRMGLADTRYTIVVGPEEFAGGSRKFRFAIVKGIVFAEMSRIKKVAPAPVRRRPLPAGVILDER